MKKNTGTLAALLLIVCGVILTWQGMKRPLQIILSQDVLTIQTRAWNVSRVLTEAGISISPYDSVWPSTRANTGWQSSIFIRRASQYRIIDLSRALDISIPSIERLPANILKDAGVRLFPGDLVLLNGSPIDPAEPLAYTPAVTIQVIPAQKFEWVYGQVISSAYSAAPTLGQALWQEGIQLQTADRVSAPLASPLRFLETIQIQPARPVTIRLPEQEISIQTSAQTVGEALHSAGVPLQGMDYAIPEESTRLPADAQVTVIRVHEEIELEQTVIPFTSEVILDPNTPIDQQRIIEAGQYGLMVSQERIRYENGEEILRSSDAEWVAAEPQPQRVGVGTQVVINTIDTPSGTLEYWRSLSAYATSYSPCRLGTGECSYTTATGMELKKGIVAVKCSLLSSMRGQQVYIPGYGVAVIGDCGGGVPGTFWIDLGFSDEDYESWHSTVTVYFLTPVPATIPYDLQ